MFDLLKFDVIKVNNYSGKLVALESCRNVPFDIKRVYYIWGNNLHDIRGHHAHKKLEQVLVCVSGACDFILDNGKEKARVHLDNPAVGLYIKHNIWREFTNFSHDCVVMVLASEHYDEKDYIRDYNEFLKVCDQ